MNEAQSIVKAARVTEVGKLSSLSEDYYPNGELFSLFLNPTESSSVSVGDVMVVEAMLPHSIAEFVEVPVVVGDWSPVVFLGLKAGTINLGEVDVYVAPMKDLII